LFIKSSTCFERYVAHHQELQLYLQPLVYIRVWWPPVVKPEWVFNGCNISLNVKTAIWCTTLHLVAGALDYNFWSSSLFTFLHSLRYGIHIDISLSLHGRPYQLFVNSAVSVVSCNMLGKHAIPCSHLLPTPFQPIFPLSSSSIIWVNMHFLFAQTIGICNT